MDATYGDAVSGFNCIAVQVVLYFKLLTSPSLCCTSDSMPAGFVCGSWQF